MDMNQNLLSYIEELSSYIKKILSIVFHSFLVLLGLLDLALLFPLQFENEFSLSEISLIEFAFWIAFFIVSRRYYRVSLAANLKLKQILYFPLRNLGLFILFWLFVFIVELFIFKDFSKVIIFEAINENVLQNIDYIGILFCIYWATPNIVHGFKLRFMALIRFNKK